MIANIERQFLKKDDLKDIHYYFGSHRPRNTMITHLAIQSSLGIGLAGPILLFHFIDRVLPGIGLPIGNLEWQRTLPYVIAVAVLFYAQWIKRHRDESYPEFLRNSLGLTVDTTGIAFGKGHGFGADGGG